jgi:hypothetical protein
MFEVPRVFCWLLATLLFLLCGCASRKSFDLGLFDVPPEYFPMVHRAGFNLVTTPVTPRVLDQARATGVQVLAFPPRSSQVRPLDRHPALWGWYLPDEPDLHGLPPFEMELAARKLSHAGGLKPKVLVLNSGSATADYPGIGDILMLDSYPVPWAPLARTNHELMIARVGKGNRRFFAILQAFDWAAFPKMVPSLTATRPPTEAELRCMTYMALAQGAEGIFYYAFKTDPWFLPENDLWIALKRLVCEIRENEPIFTANHVWFRHVADYLDGRENAFNEVGDLKVLFRMLRVRAPNARIPAGDYLLFVNTADEEIPFRFQLPDYAPQPLEDRLTDRIIQPKDHWFQATAAPYAVHVFGPLFPRITLRSDGSGANIPRPLR